MVTAGDMAWSSQILYFRWYLAAGKSDERRATRDG